MGERPKEFLARAFILGSAWGVGFSLLMTPAMYILTVIAGHLEPDLADVDALTIWSSVAAVSIPGGLVFGVFASFDARPRYIRIPAERMPEVEAFILNGLKGAYVRTYESEGLTIFNPAKGSVSRADTIEITTGPSGLTVRAPRNVARELKEAVPVTR